MGSTTTPILWLQKANAKHNLDFGWTSAALVHLPVNGGRRHPPPGFLALLHSLFMNRKRWLCCLGWNTIILTSVVKGCSSIKPSSLMYNLWVTAGPFWPLWCSRLAAGITIHYSWARWDCFLVLALLPCLQGTDRQGGPALWSRPSYAWLMRCGLSLLASRLQQDYSLFMRHWGVASMFQHWLSGCKGVSQPATWPLRYNSRSECCWEFSR